MVRTMHRSLERRPRRPGLLPVLLACLGSGAVSVADEVRCQRPPVTERPTIGLVLGGGGARGGAHVGVLRKLEELRVPVDYVAGTSMGSIIGALTATGMTATEIERVLGDIDWSELFDDRPNRQDFSFRRKTDDDLALYFPKVGVGAESSHIAAGAVSGQKISYLFQLLTTERVLAKDFNELPVPFRAVAADVVTGRQVVLDSGDLTLAMRASMSVPGAFDPVPFGDALLVDGGIVNNLPADVVKAMGADVVIAVDVSAPPLPREELTNALAVLGQLTTLAVVNNTRRQIDDLSERDIVITPELGDTVGSADFETIAEAFPIGYAAADRHHAALAALGLDEPAYRAYRASLDRCLTELPPVEFVRVENATRFEDAVIEERVNIPLGEPLDQARLRDDLEQIYALGFIRLARHEIVTEDGRSGVVIRVDEDPRGTQFIESGLDMTLGGDGGAINLRAGYLKTDLDSLGSEFRVTAQIGEDPGVLAEVYKYLTPDRRWFFLPRVSWQNSDSRLFDDDGIAVAEFEISEWTTSAAVGREFSRHAAVMSGIRRSGGEIDLSIGPPSVSGENFDGGEWFVLARYDRVDNRYIPSDGSIGELEYIVSRDVFGADVDFEQLRSSWATTFSRDRHAFTGGFRYNTTTSGSAPDYALFTGGGFLNLSGFEANELIGPHFGVLLGSYRYEVGRTGFLPAYAGFSIEYGDVADERDEIFDDALLNGSLFFAYDSPLGPVYLGYGRADGRSGVIFLRLGTVLGRDSIGR